MQKDLMDCRTCKVTPVTSTGNELHFLGYGRTDVLVSYNYALHSKITSPP